MAMAEPQAIWTYGWSQNENRDKLIPVLETLGILPEDLDHIKKIDFTHMLA